MQCNQVRGSTPTEIIIRGVSSTWRDTYNAYYSVPGSAPAFERQILEGRDSIYFDFGMHVPIYSRPVSIYSTVHTGQDRTVRQSRSGGPGRGLHYGNRQYHIPWGRVCAWTSQTGLDLSLGVGSAKRQATIFGSHYRNPGVSYSCSALDSIPSDEMKNCRD